MKYQPPQKGVLIFLAAGSSQIPLIQKAKDLGYSIVAIDQNEKAPGFLYADFKIYHSTHDGDAIIHKLKKLNLKFIGIINKSSGPPVFTSALISKKFKLPGIPVNSCKSLVNKDQMRTSCKNYKIPIPKYKIFSSKQIRNNRQFNYPVIVKPSLSLKGKSGISLVSSNNKINSALNYAFDNTINKKVLVEEYLQGLDFSLISFVNNKKLFPICLLEELNIVDKKGSVMPRGYRTIKQKDFHFKEKANAIAQKIISKFGIVRSPLNISFRSTANKALKIIEVHLDIGGDFLLEKFFPKAMSFDFKKLIIEMSIGSAKVPKDLNMKPTALFYKHNLVSNKNFEVITANSNKILDKKILNLSL